MSANWAIRSFGAPYFCLRQQDLAGMDGNGLGDQGVVELSVTFRLFALPVQHSDPQEIHALFSFCEFLLGTRIMEIGVTPSGQYVAAVYPDTGGPVALTAIGAVSPDNQWHTLYARWDSGTGDLLLDVDSGRLTAVANTGLAGAAIAGLAMLMLFNDAAGYARTDAAIRSAYCSFASSLGSSGEVDYVVNEKSGALVAAALATAGTYPIVQSFDLTAEYYPLSRVRPWGPPPSDATPGTEAYGWTVNTEHTEVTPAATRHTEVAIT